MDWVDRKRWWWLAALAMPLLPFAAIALFDRTGNGIWLWLGPIVILGVVPLVDLAVGRDGANPPEALLPALEADRYYRVITWLFLPLQYAGLVTAMYVVARGDLSTAERVGLSVTVGFIAGLGINTAHELGHKREDLERRLSQVALAQTAYGHFYVEHNRGHHVRVATPDDPASARMGESFYRFWPRSVVGSVRSAWVLERRRLSRGGRSALSLRNEALAAWCLTAVLFAALVLWLGVGVLPYLVLQAVVGLTLLEAVNYLEHYGLLRGRVGAGEHERWERVEPRHSWNSNNVATNVLLYHLQRHSDHHANPTRRYQALRDDAGAPVLPTGYAGMILLALVPPLWRRTMDPRVVAHYSGDVARANLAPHARASLVSRWSPVVDGGVATAPPVSAGGVATIDPAASSATVAVASRSATGGSGAGAARMACPGCGYVYDVARGDAHEGFAPGTPWSAVPESWCCPDCGVRDKRDFVPAP